MRFIYYKQVFNKLGHYHSHAPFYLYGIPLQIQNASDKYKFNCKQRLHAAYPFSSLSQTQNESSQAAQKLIVLRSRVEELQSRKRSKHVTLHDMFNIWKLCCGPEAYPYALSIMNTIYNFGNGFNHSQIASRLVSLCIQCHKPEEAARVIQLYKHWIRYPPKTSLILSVMEHFYLQGNYDRVREIFASIRENWQIRLSTSGYMLTINSMLRKSEDAIQDAMQVYIDSLAMSVTLPPAFHASLLDTILIQLGPPQLLIEPSGINIVDVNSPGSNEDCNIEERSNVRTNRHKLYKAASIVEEHMLKACVLFGIAIPPQCLTSLSWLNWLRTCQKVDQNFERPQIQQTGDCVEVFTWLEQLQHAKQRQIELGRSLYCIHPVFLHQLNDAANMGFSECQEAYDIALDT